MKNLRFLLIGVLFGIILTKSEVISWYRIQEMFRFQSFHMYGIIGSAVMVGALIILLFKKGSLKTLTGGPPLIEDKVRNYKAALFGGTVFGLGWALTGACPGPIYVLIGGGFLIYVVVLICAIFGAFIYGVLRPYLPH